MKKHSSTASIDPASVLNPRGGFLCCRLVVYSARSPTRRRSLATEHHHTAQGEFWLVRFGLPQVTGRCGHALAALLILRETHGCGKTLGHKR